MMRARRGEEGFTLIELTVSLVAGLIVALGIMGLSRDATHTFHEEMRSSAAEANLRTAVDRLRADLSRAAYMSTSNMALDPMVTRPPGIVNPINPALAGLARLTSVYLQQGSSIAATPLSAVQDVPMTPDAIEIGGNMTSTDQYVVSLVEPGGACGGERLVLDWQSPEMYRILALPNGFGAQELNHAFAPAPTGQFIVRFVDNTGHSQFLMTCAGTTAGIAGTQPFVDIDPQTPVLNASVTQVGSVNGYASVSMINPVQIVRWEILAEPAAYAGSPLGGLPFAPTGGDPTKYDLVRSYVDAVTGLTIPGTTEIVAEYAVDLKFAFTVDRGPSTLQPIIATFPLDDTANNPLWAPNITTTAQVPGVPIGPQRIRSVRVRLATRAAEADRTLDVLVPNPTGPFTYRYCVLPGGCNPTVNPTGVLQYARARTLTAEVALPNQARNY